MSRTRPLRTKALRKARTPGLATLGPARHERARHRRKARANPERVLDRLRSALERAWSAETSSEPEGWSPANPAWGQCAVSALVVQDLLGGELVRSIVQDTPHYWNRLPDGREVDLSLAQFGASPEIAREPQIRSREYVLQFQHTRQRYEALRRALSMVAAGDTPPGSESPS
jgi:hypothetical protein